MDKSPGQDHTCQAGHPLQHPDGIGEGPGPKKYPCRIDKVKGDEPGDKSRQSERALLPKPKNHQRAAVKQPPDDKRPACSMPETYKKKCNENIQKGSQLSSSASAKWNVDVVTDKPTQRHMPPAPELLDGQGSIRAVEVNGELDIE